jgi:hypothetical protein
MDASTHPLAGRLNSSSTNALIGWCLLYAITHPGTVTPASIARGFQGDRHSRQASALLLAYGVGWK